MPTRRRAPSAFNFNTIPDSQAAGIYRQTINHLSVKCRLLSPSFIVCKLSIPNNLPVCMPQAVFQKFFREFLQVAVSFVQTKREVQIKQQAVWLKTNCKNTKFAVYKSSADFATQAKELMHPFDNFHFMPELMVSSLKFVLRSGPVVVVKHRFETLCLWRSWAQELKTEEKSLHATLRPGGWWPTGGSS